MNRVIGCVIIHNMFHTMVGQESNTASAVMYNEAIEKKNLKRKRNEELYNEHLSELISELNASVSKLRTQLSQHLEAHKDLEMKLSFVHAKSKCLKDMIAHSKSMIDELEKKKM